MRVGRGGEEGVLEKVVQVLHACAAAQTQPQLQEAVGGEEAAGG